MPLGQSGAAGRTHPLRQVHDRTHLRLTGPYGEQHVKNSRVGLTLRGLLSANPMQQLLT